MEKDIYLIYDGTFNGFLTAVYFAFDKQLRIAGIQSKDAPQKELFTENRIIITNIDMAKSVWNTVSHTNAVAMKSIYFAFLSETKGIPFLLYQYIRKLVSKTSSDQKELPGGSIRTIYNLAERVATKKKYLESFLKLESSKDGILFGVLDNMYDLLPLISRYFRIHHQDKDWLLYDHRRNYGLYYNKKNVQLVSFGDSAFLNRITSASGIPCQISSSECKDILKKSKLKGILFKHHQTHKLKPSRLSYEHSREAV